MATFLNPAAGLGPSLDVHDVHMLDRILEGLPQGMVRACHNNINMPDGGTTYLRYLHSCLLFVPVLAGECVLRIPCMDINQLVKSSYIINHEQQVAHLCLGPQISRPSRAEIAQATN